jgi:hypothetical protein
MNSSAVQAPAIAILIVYLTGLASGVFGCAVYASVLENCNMSLLRRAPDPICAGIRVMLGLFIRDDGYLRYLPPGGQATWNPHGQGRDQ